MKKIIKTFIAAFALITVFTVFQVSAYKKSDTIKIIDHVVYQDKGSYFTVIDFFDTDKIANTAISIKITNSINGKPVKKIATGSAKHGLSEIKSVKYISIPSSVTHIGEYSFSQFTSVEKLELPSKLSSIGRGAFSYMKNLTTITIPPKVTAIGDFVFYNCLCLESVYFKGDVNEVGYSAFSGCQNLRHVSGFDNIDTIGDYAFMGCGFTSLTLHNGYTYGTSAFKKCLNIKRVEYVTEKKPYNITINYGFLNDFTSLEEIVFPKEVKYLKINFRALSYCTKLEELVLPKKAKGIYLYSGALSSCTSLKRIVNTDCVVSYGDHCFSNCEKLTSLTISSKTKSIDLWTFFGCKGLKKLKILSTNPELIKNDFASYLPVGCTVYVKTKEMKNQLIKHGFSGTVKVKKNLS